MGHQGASYCHAAVDRYDFLAFGVGSHPSSECRGNHRGGDRLGVVSGLRRFSRGHRRRRIRHRGHVRPGSATVPDGNTGSQSGTGHRIRNPRGVPGGGRRDHRAVRRPHGVPTRILASRGEHVAKDGGGQCRRSATAGRHYVLRSRGGDGNDHSLGCWRCPLPTGRPGGTRRNRVLGRVPARCVGGGGGRRPCARASRGLRTQLAAAGVRGNGVVRPRS